MRLLLKVSYLQLCHDQVTWAEKLGERKEILIASMQLLLRLQRIVFAVSDKVSGLPVVKNQLMGRGWEVSWQRESTPSHLTVLEGAWCGTEEPCTLLTSLLTLHLCRAESLQTLFRVESVHTDSPCHK